MFPQFSPIVIKHQIFSPEKRIKEGETKTLINISCISLLISLKRSRYTHEDIFNYNAIFFCGGGCLWNAVKVPLEYTKQSCPRVSPFFSSKIKERAQARICISPFFDILLRTTTWLHALVSLGVRTILDSNEYCTSLFPQESRHNRRGERKKAEGETIISHFASDKIFFNRVQFGKKCKKNVVTDHRRTFQCYYLIRNGTLILF